MELSGLNTAFPQHLLSFRTENGTKNANMVSGRITRTPIVPTVLHQAILYQGGSRTFRVCQSVISLEYLFLLSKLN